MDEFIKTLIAEVKSQGVFDEFRFNCCLADVDTKPAYQNVRTRVETAVNDFLAKQHWTPDTNKVQLRERLRKHLLDCEVLNKGVDQIVDQVVNPKVATIFEPKIESIVYKYLGITPPPPPPRPAGPLLPAPPLPPFAGHMNGSSLLRVETGADGLMPTDLEQISPDSDQATVKSDLKDESKDDDLPPGVDNERNYDEDTSPSYEPLSEDKPGSSKELNNGLLNHSDSINGVSQASQLSQVSSDSRLTIASSTESVAEAHRAAPATNSVELIASMPANISEEAQMPKFNENSSDASAAALGVDNSSRQLHFDIKQDAITFEGTERRSSVSGTNGGPLELSIEDAIMSEVKANIDDANNASIDLKHVHQPPLPPLPKVEPEPVQPPAPPDVEPEPVQPPPPPPPPPEIKEEPVQPPAPPEVKLEPEQPSPPPEMKVEPVQPATPPELKSESEPIPKVEPPATPPATEGSNGSCPEACVQDAKPKECESPLKHEPPTVAGEVKDEKPQVFAFPEEAEAPKGDVITTKACESTASPSSVSSQSKSSSRDKDKDRDKDKEQRSHSHSDEKQRRRSRDRDRDRDRSRDKSHSKHSSSSSLKHSSSRSSSSQHKSSSSKNDRSSTGSSSKSHRESSSSSSKRTSSSTTSSRHESSSSSSHKKHKSSSSSRSDRDKDRDRDKDKERESHSRSHHSNSSSSSSSKRKDHDRGRDRDRNKSSSATIAPIKDDHTESKAKLNKRRSSDSNDEGKPPGSGCCPPKSSHSQPEVPPEKAIESVENGNGGTNGNSNCGSGSNGATDSASMVVIVSDRLQQSSSSFIELTAGFQSQKEEDGKRDEEVAEKNVDQAEEAATQEDRLGSEHQNESESVPNSPDKGSKRGGDGPGELPAEAECKSTDPAETETSEPSEGSLPEAIQKEDVEPPENMPAPQGPNSTSNDEPAEDDVVTHFEENADEFSDRLRLINRLIEDGQNLVNQLSEDHAQVEAAHIREIRRRTVKRRCSSLQEQPQVGRESTPPPALVSSTSGSPAKRLCREEPKSSPTPSEASVNSKENEALEKQEHDALNARRFSQKLCQQQRYTNDDLYKPRPILSQRSRRRGLDSIL